MEWKFGYNMTIKSGNGIMGMRLDMYCCVCVCVTNELWEWNHGNETGCM